MKGKVKACISLPITCFLCNKGTSLVAGEKGGMVAEAAEKGMAVLSTHLPGRAEEAEPFVPTKYTNLLSSPILCSGRKKTYSHLLSLLTFSTLSVCHGMAPTVKSSL